MQSNHYRRPPAGAIAPRWPVIVRLPNWVGDVVMALPALDRLEAAGADLRLVGKRWAGSLLGQRYGDVTPIASGTRARSRQLRELARTTRAGPEPGAGTALDRRARRGVPDAVLLTNSFSSALDARLAGLHPLGYRQDGRGWLLSDAIPPPIGPVHESERFDRLARAWVDARATADADRRPDEDRGSDESAERSAEPGAPDTALPRLDPEPDAKAMAERLLRGALGQPAGPLPPFACIVPFATGTLNGQNKAWPDFPAFARELAGRLPVVVVPGPDEVEQARSRFAECHRLEGVDLGTYGAVLARAAVVVANDTGPAHLAAAVGAPLVSVLGPTDAARYRPRGRAVTIVQRSPWPTVAEVRSAVDHVLDAGAGGPAAGCG